MSYWSGPWTLQSNSHGHVGSELAKWTCFGRMTSKKTHWANNNVAKWTVCLPGRYLAPTAASFLFFSIVFETKASFTRSTIECRKYMNINFPLHANIGSCLQPHLPVDTFFCQSTNSRPISTFQPLILQPQHHYESNRTR
jgi:hypothetical protein